MSPKDKNVIDCYQDHRQHGQSSIVVHALQKEDELAHAFRKRGVQPLDDTSLWACFGRLVNYKDSLPVSHDTLAMNIGFFFTAGYKTTAHLINWALFKLAANPDIQVTQSALYSSFNLFSVQLFVCLFVYASIHPPTHPHIHPSIILRVFVASFTCWHSHLFIHLLVSQACTVLKR